MPTLKELKDRYPNHKFSFFMDLSKDGQYTRTPLTDKELCWTIDEYDDRILKPLIYMIDAKIC